MESRASPPGRIHLVHRVPIYNAAMRVTLFGASGLLGQELVQELKAEQLAALSSKDADLRDHSRVREVIRDSRPDWILLSAAYTDVDGCESNRDLAFAVNCDGAVNVAKAARETGSRLMFLSTDYVFDGSKRSPYETTDARKPTTVYGESKACAEERLLEILPEVCIVRTSWLFGHGGKCFPATILKLASTRPEISVVNDQRGSPTFTRDLASALVQLCRASAKGIVHVTRLLHRCPAGTYPPGSVHARRSLGAVVKTHAIKTSETNLGGVPDSSAGKGRNIHG